LFLKEKSTLKAELVSAMRVTVLILPLHQGFLGHMDKKGYMGTLLVHG